MPVAKIWFSDSNPAAPVLRSGSVTFCTAPPPLVSYICVWCPGLPPPTVEAAGADVVLLRVPLRRRCYGGERGPEYFVYKAAAGKGPSLRRLQNPEPFLDERYNIALLARRDVFHDDGDSHYHVAALNHPVSGPDRFALWLFDSKDEKWSSSPVAEDGLLHDLADITSKVIALGEGGVLGFVDAWRGVFVCDVLGRRPARYLPLPQILIRPTMYSSNPLLCRDVAVVELCRITEPDSITDRWGWSASAWNISISNPWEVEQKDWREEYKIESHHISVDNHTGNVELLPKLQDSEGTPRPALGRLHIAHPTLSLSDHHVVYIMGKVDRGDKKALVLSVDLRSARLRGAAMFDAERMVGTTFGYTYTQARISAYFDTVGLLGPGVKGNLKRPGEFVMQYPRKQQAGAGITTMDDMGYASMQLSDGDQEQHNTGAEDGDDDMALD